MLKKILFLLLIYFPLFLGAQNKKVLLKGKTIDSLGIIKNVNIVNLKTKQGTFSNDQGLFRIYASKGDTLLFSSIQHISKKIIVSTKNIQTKEINILLKSNVYALNEITLKKNNLKGILTIDIKALPKSKRDSVLKDNLNFSNVNLNDVDLRIDDNKRAMPPITIVDPNKKFEGLNLLGFLSLKKKRFKPIIKDNFDKNEIPNKLLTELGEDYFFKTLKIPRQQYQHFLEFCDLPKIQNLYKKGKLLQIIQVFQDKSVTYLKIVHKKQLHIYLYWLITVLYIKDKN